MLFELLTGQRPFDAPSTLELAVQALTKGVPDVRTLRPDCPADLAAVVARAVAREPGDRLGSVQELRLLLQQVYAEQPPLSPPSPASPLSPIPLPLPTPLQPPVRPPSSIWERVRERVRPRALVAGAALAAAIVIGLFGWLLGTRATQSETTRRSSVEAVLPVEVPPESPELETAAAGIGEIMTANLAVLPGLQVLPRSETAAALGRDRDLKRVLHDLAPAYVVKAAVRGSPSQLGLDVNLLDDKGRVAWTRSYDGRGDDPFALPARVSSDVGRAMTEVGAVSPRAPSFSMME